MFIFVLAFEPLWKSYLANCDDIAEGGAHRPAVNA